MSQQAEIKEISNDALLDFFRVKVGTMADSSAQNYRKAVAALSSFAYSQSVSSNIASTSFIENWLVHLFIQGFTIKTSLHYFDIISGLYSSAVKDGIAEATDVFKKFKAKTKLIASDSWRQMISEADFARLLNVTKLADRQSGEALLSSDILLFSLMNEALSLSEIANLKREDLPQYDEESNAIATRHIEGRRKYVFPLEQSKYTAKQLESAVTQLIAKLFNNRNIKSFGNIQDSIRSYWAYAALRCGASAETVIGILGARPSGMPILNLCSQANRLLENQRKTLSQTVANVFIVNPYNWYAMRLRPGIKFNRLTERLDEIDEQYFKPELFYPCNEIAKRIKKKIVYEEKPILPDIVFFKSRVTDIQPLFNKIGDLAWCYTDGGAYASISKKAMENFQRAIGMFTPDYEVGPVGTIPLRKGDKIVVIGGAMAGRQGEIIDETLDDQNVIYRIMLWGDYQNIEWRVNDPRLIAKQ